MISEFKPADACSLLEDWSKPWWVAGGYALDLFLQSESRDHGDLDISILKADDHSFRTFLPSMTFWADIGNGTPGSKPLRPDECPPDPPRVMWCRNGTEGDWCFDLFTEKHGQKEWLFKRSNEVTMPLNAIGYRTSDGIPYLRPEIVLLHKAKNNRLKDLSDFHTVLPHLDTNSKSWLKNSLAKVHPRHQWQTYL